MPDTTVQKMIGAITILISLMKPSPSALIQSLVASVGASQPTTTPSRIAISTCTYSILYQGLAAPARASVVIAAAMTFPPRQNLRICLSLFADSRPTGYNQDRMTERSQWRCLRPPAVLAAAIDHMPDRRHKGCSECVLDHGRGEERRDPDQPCLVDAELHAKREPCAAPIISTTSVCSVIGT